MSRFGLLVLLLSLFLGSALGATFSYTVYSDTSCSSQVSKGTVAAYYGNTKATPATLRRASRSAALQAAPSMPSEAV